MRADGRLRRIVHAMHAAAAQGPAILRREDGLVRGEASPHSHHFHQVLRGVGDKQRPGIVGEELQRGFGDHGAGLFRGEAGLQPVAHFVEQQRLFVAHLEFAHPLGEHFVGLLERVLGALAVAVGHVQRVRGAQDQGAEHHHVRDGKEQQAHFR